MNKLLLAISIMLSFSFAEAKRTLLTQNEQEVETEEVNDDRVGQKAATKYFEKRSTSSADRSHYLAIHVGGFLSSDAYSWGVNDNGRNVDHKENAGKLNIGLTYRMGEWTDTMDLNLRVDFQTYELYRDKPLKMSVMPLLTFPDANSQFPLYFGAGAGPGIFFKQVSQESSLSLDYQLVAGARLFDLIENTGFFLEFGLKNHLLLLSDGQFNGVFLAAGAIFTF